MTFDRLDKLEQGRIVVDLMGTESEEKVLSMLKKIFPSARIRKEGGRLDGKADLSHFKELVKKEKIRATVESILDENAAGETSFIDLNKMAALAGRIAMDEDSPMGKIRLHLPWKKA